MPVTRVLIAGASARAAAESAANAGYTVLAVDAFADLDQHQTVRIIEAASGVRFAAESAARIAARLQTDAAAYLSGFENHPRAVAQLARGRRLWGNPPSVLREVRDPFVVADRLAARGFVVPALLRGSLPDAAHVPSRPSAVGVGAGQDGPSRWLVKPVASGGGRRVRLWEGGPTSPRSVAAGTGGHSRRPGGGVVPADCYLQALVEGVPMSLAFVADGGRVVPIGLSRQLVGERAFGSSGFRYCGSILALDRNEAGFAAYRTLLARATALAEALTLAFGLVGANGIDVIARDDVPHLIEINPRWCSSMELVERAYGVSVFGAHADACASGRLPSFDVVGAAAGGEVLGKAIVFATTRVTVGDTRQWLGDPDVRDVPRPGTRIRAQQPICTVFASGATEAACHIALVERANDIYARVQAWRRRVA